MKFAIVTIAFAVGSNALVSRASGCSFHLTATGPGHVVDQLNDGQNRIGQLYLPEGQYSIDSNGGVTDSMGRGCIFTPPTTQWQCNVGASPTPGFSIGCDGTLSHNHTAGLWSCPSGQDGGWNIYSEPIKEQKKCVQITLQADGCGAGCPSSAIPVTSTTPAATTSEAPKSTCPGSLEGEFEFPHLITPIDSSNPDYAYGTAYNGTMAGTRSSIFNFDIPASYKGKTCTLEFLFPLHSQLETSSYVFSGPGSFHVAALSGLATQSTTFNNAPKVAHDFGDFVFTPGSATKIGAYPCDAEQVATVWIKANNDSVLNYFQDYNPCPIGLYSQVS